jgi:putative transposase
VDEIRTRVNSGYALGSARFGQEIADTLGRRTTPGRPGRPSRQT